MEHFNNNKGMGGIEGLFNPERRRLAEAYNQKKRRNKRIVIFLEIVFWIVIFSLSLEKISYNCFDRLFRHKELKILVFLCSFYLLYSIFNLPLDYFLVYRLDKLYKLSNQSKKEWFVDEIKSFIMELFFFYFAVRIYLYFMILSPVYWWLYYTVLASILTILLTFIFPVVLLPIFFKLESYPDSELKKNLFQLIKKAGLKIDDIYEINLSEKTNASNAAVIGLGSTRKIVLSDNLKDMYSDDEIETILGHELGHQEHGDIFKTLIMESFLILIIAYIVFRTWPFIVSFSGYNNLQNVASIPLLILFISLLSWLFSPLQLFISRKVEKRADLYTTRLTGKVDSFAIALAKLADESLAPLEVNLFEKTFELSHPMVKERIEYILR